MAPNGSQRLPTAPYDYKHTLLLFSSSMTPTDFHLLPPRELTPQPYSQARLDLYVGTVMCLVLFLVVWLIVLIFGCMAAANETDDGGSTECELR